MWLLYKIAKAKCYKVKNMQDVTGMMLSNLVFFTLFFICLFIFLFIYLLIFWSYLKIISSLQMTESYWECKIGNNADCMD